MRVLIAPDSFKGTLTAAQAAEAMATGIGKSFPGARCTLLPLADGGEGTLDAVKTSLGDGANTARIRSLDGSIVDAGWLQFGESRLVESASVTGLGLPRANERTPDRYHTWGLGDLLCLLLQSSPKHIYVGLGGSGTHDCGAGMAHAMGYRFYDSLESKRAPSYCGSITDFLHSVKRIEPPGKKPWQDVQITALADVENPLTGRRGAAHTYAAQKGFGDVERLENATRAFAGIVCRDVARVKHEDAGMGAAGGLGFALAAFCGARIVRGIDWVMEQTGFRDACADADIVVTGEGKYDAQTLFGKAAHRVNAVAKELGVPSAVVAGKVEGSPDDFLDGENPVAVIQCAPGGKEPPDKDTAFSQVTDAAAAWFAEYSRSAHS